MFLLLVSLASATEAPLPDLARLVGDADKEAAEPRALPELHHEAEAAPPEVVNSCSGCISVADPALWAFGLPRGAGGPPRALSDVPSVESIAAGVEGGLAPGRPAPPVPRCAEPIPELPAADLEWFAVAMEVPAVNPFAIHDPLGEWSPFRGGFRMPEVEVMGLR